MHITVKLYKKMGKSVTKSISKYEAVLHNETDFSNQLDHPEKGFVTFN